MNQNASKLVEVCSLASTSTGYVVLPQAWSRGTSSSSAASHDDDDDDDSNFTFSTGADSTADFNFSPAYMESCEHDGAALSPPRMSHADELFQNGKIRPLHPFAPLHQPFQAISVYEEHPVLERVHVHESCLPTPPPLHQPNHDWRLISNYLISSASAPTPLVGAYHQQQSSYHSFGSPSAIINRSVVAKPTSNVVYSLPLRSVFHISDAEAPCPPNEEPFTSENPSRKKLRDLLSQEVPCSTTRLPHTMKPGTKSSTKLSSSGQPFWGEKPSSTSIKALLEPHLRCDYEEQSYAAKAHLRSYDYEEQSFAAKAHLRRYDYEEQSYAAKAHLRRYDYDHLKRYDCYEKQQYIHKGKAIPKKVKKLQLAPPPIRTANMAHMRPPKKGHVVTSPHAHHHYITQRAQAESKKKKTFLPYRQRLLACLGFF